MVDADAKFHGSVGDDFNAVYSEELDDLMIFDFLELAFDKTLLIFEGELFALEGNKGLFFGEGVDKSQHGGSIGNLGWTDGNSQT